MDNIGNHVNSRVGVPENELYPLQLTLFSTFHSLAYFENLVAQFGSKISPNSIRIMEVAVAAESCLHETLYKTPRFIAIRLKTASIQYEQISRRSGM